MPADAGGTTLSVRDLDHRGRDWYIDKAVAGLVFLDAYAPEDGQSAFAVRNAVPGATPLAEAADGIEIGRAHV